MLLVTSHHDMIGLRGAFGARPPVAYRRLRAGWSGSPEDYGRLRMGEWGPRGYPGYESEIALVLWWGEKREPDGWARARSVVADQWDARDGIRAVPLHLLSIVNGTHYPRPDELRQVAEALIAMGLATRLDVLADEPLAPPLDEVCGDSEARCSAAETGGRSRPGFNSVSEALSTRVGVSWEGSAYDERTGEWAGRGCPDLTVRRG